MVNIIGMNKMNDEQKMYIKNQIFTMPIKFTQELSNNDKQFISHQRFAF